LRNRNDLLLVVIDEYVEDLGSFVCLYGVNYTKSIGVDQHKFSLGAARCHQSEPCAHIKASDTSVLLLSTILILIFPELVEVESIKNFNCSIEGRCNQSDIFDVLDLRNFHTQLLLLFLVARCSRVRLVLLRPRFVLGCLLRIEMLITWHVLALLSRSMLATCPRLRAISFSFALVNIELLLLVQDAVLLMHFPRPTTC